MRREIAVEKLRRICDPEKLDYNTSADMKDAGELERLDKQVALYALSHLLDDLKRKYQIRPDPGKAQRNDAARTRKKKQKKNDTGRAHWTSLSY